MDVTIAHFVIMCEDDMPEFFVSFTAHVMCLQFNLSTRPTMPMSCVLASCCRLQTRLDIYNTRDFTAVNI